MRGQQDADCHARLPRLFRQILQARCDIERIADHRERRIFFVTDVAEDHEAGVDADVEADWPGPFIGELRAEPPDIVGDQRARLDRLAAGFGRRLVGIGRLQRG
jgi:hypothetical protein